MTNQPNFQPGVVISSHPSLHAYTTTTNSTKISFTITNPSPALTDLLAKAPPALSFSDHIHYPTNPRGRPRTIPTQGKTRFKAGIYLDDLPATVPRPQLIRADASPAAGPERGLAPTTSAAAPTKEPTSGKSAEAAATAAENKKMTTKKPTAPPAKGTNTEPATSTAARSKGLEIDMVPGTFMAEGEGRGSRPKKRPARFDDGVEVEKKKKSSKRSKLG
ncbi:MAG: hypothetical protein Q9181_005574 [Wetmoreana brouardii]